MPRPLVDLPETSLSPRAEMLLWGARPPTDIAGAEPIRNLLLHDIDWPLLIQAAFQQGTAPLLYHHLTRTCSDAIPEAALERFRGDLRALAWQNLILTEELVELLRRFEARGIAVVPFKGPLLAAAIYSNPLLRPFGDLDILVRRPDILAARDLLLTEGYRLDSEQADIPAATLLRSPREHHFTLIHERKTVVVELHWRTIQECYRVPLDAEGLWERRVPVSFEGIQTFGFGPEDLLLLLCVHGAKHEWNKLGLICDLDGLVRTSKDLNWDEVMRRAQAVGGQRLFALGLRLARDLLETPLPKAVSQWVQADSQAKDLSEEVVHCLFKEEAGPANSDRRWAFYLRARERLRDRIGVCRSIGRIPHGVEPAVLPWLARWYIRIALALPIVFALLDSLMRSFGALGKWVCGIGKRV